MSKAVKGLLLSGLVLPGLGQMALKRHLRGAIFLVVAVGALIALMVKATQTALDIVAQTTPALESLDIDQMFTAANQAVAQANTGGMSIAFLVIVVAWLGSSVDAFLLGRQLDRTAASQAPLPGEETSADR